MEDKFKLKAILFWQEAKGSPEENEKKKADLYEYCRLNDYKVYEDYVVDINEHRQKSMRSILDMLNNKLFEVLIVYSLLDMAQDSTELLRYLKEIHETEIHFISLKDNINSRYFESRELLRLASILLGFKHRRLSEKVKSVMRLKIKQAKEEGRQLGIRGKDKKKRQTSGYIERMRREESIAQSKQNPFFNMHKK